MYWLADGTRLQQRCDQDQVGQRSTWTVFLLDSHILQPFEEPRPRSSSGSKLRWYMLSWEALGDRTLTIRPVQTPLSPALPEVEREGNTPCGHRLRRGPGQSTLAPPVRGVCRARKRADETGRLSLGKARTKNSRVLTKHSH